MAISNSVQLYLISEPPDNDFVIACSRAVLETGAAVGFTGRNGEYHYFRFVKSNATVAIVVNKINVLAADPDIFVCAVPFVVGTATCPFPETYLFAWVC
jgi:hypothetical protein